MRVLVLEDNLIWSGRLRLALQSLGHTSEVVSKLPEQPLADLAVVNLSGPRLQPFEAVARLKELGIPVIGHAGHKEKELWEKGREAGCDRIVSNSEMTNKLEQILAELQSA